MSAGSSTACIVVLDRQSHQLHTANLGDSGFLLVRGGEVVHRSDEQQHYFNTPFQLSIAPPGAEGAVLSDRWDTRQGNYPASAVVTTSLNWVHWASDMNSCECSHIEAILLLADRSLSLRHLAREIIQISMHVCKQLWGQHMQEEHMYWIANWPVEGQQIVHAFSTADVMKPNTSL